MCEVGFRFVLRWPETKEHLDATADTEIVSQRADAAPGGYTAAFAWLYPEIEAYLWEKTQKLPVFWLGLIASCFTCPAKR